MTKKYCRSSLSEEACKEDSSCTRVNNHSYHPFSILVNGKYVDANEKNCTGEMHEEPYLMVYEDQCGLMPPVLYGNTSFGKHYDPANSSPDKNFGIFKDCWNCIKKVKDLKTDTDGRVKQAGNVSKQIATCMDLNEGKLSKYMESSATVINKKVSEKRIVSSTPKYCCRDGPNGKTYTFFQGDGKTDFNKQKYSPWGEEQAKNYCMSYAANEGKAPDGLFYNRSCKAVDSMEQKMAKGANVTLARETTQYCCRDGPNGETFTFFKGDGKTDFNEQKYSPWDEEQAKAYCMSSAANEGKSPDGLFYNRPCEAVEDHDGGQYRNDIDTCLDSKSIENCI